MGAYRDIDKLAVIAPNFKRRLSGVTSTIIQLVPEQIRQGLAIATVGTGLPDHMPKLRYGDLWRLWKRPLDGAPRVWHARRNTEMIAGILMRDVMRMPLKLVFTSAAQRDHKAFTKWLIGRMDTVIATSAKSGAYLDVPHTVIMHGVDTNRFVPPASKTEAKRALAFDPEKRVAGCAGRIRHSKGTDLFVDAMIALLPDYAGWDAVITGRATAEHAAYKADLVQRIAEAGLQERIRFVGEVDDILPFYQAFDLFIAPSRNEGFGLTPLEAMACGVPCVTSDAGSYAQMILAGQTGLVVTDGGFSAAIEALLADDARRKDMGEKTRAHVLRQHSLDGEARALMNQYADLRQYGG